MIKLSDWKDKWIEALRSGEYEQGKGKLYSRSQHGTRYCCLGVLEEISGIKSPNRGMLEAPDEYGRGHSIINGLPLKAQSHLAGLNDKENFTFSEIADWIEKNL